jgi:hypothetical protein
MERSGATQNSVELAKLLTGFEPQTPTVSIYSPASRIQRNRSFTNKTQQKQREVTSKLHKLIKASAESAKILPKPEWKSERTSFIYMSFSRAWTFRPLRAITMSQQAVAFAAVF